jgi:hypothetical protein
VRELGSQRNAKVAAAIEFSVNATAIEVAPKRRSVQSWGVLKLAIGYA